MNERNKIICIADYYGWDVAEEYMDDPITENREDVTKLRQVEYRAKIKGREKVRQRKEQVLIIEIQIPKEQLLIFFVCLAQNIERKHLEVKEQKLPLRRRTLCLPKPAHERYPDSHQQPLKSKKTVKYNFLILHDREHELEHFVLNIIGNGYLIPLFSNSPTSQFKNKSSALNHVSFV